MITHDVLFLTMQVLQNGRFQDDPRANQARFAIYTYLNKPSIALVSELGRHNIAFF